MKIATRVFLRHDLHVHRPAREPLALNRFVKVAMMRLAIKADRRHCLRVRQIFDPRWVAARAIALSGILMPAIVVLIFRFLSWQVGGALTWFQASTIVAEFLIPFESIDVDIRPTARPLNIHYGVRCIQSPRARRHVNENHCSANSRCPATGTER
jgi:hypothetical protein